jgi:hypothetical protein
MKEQKSTGVPESIEWEFAIPLVTDRFMLADMVKVVGISVGIMCVLMLTIGAFQGRDGFTNMLHLLPMFGVVGLGILVLFVLICLVFYRNRFPVRFTVTKAGAACEVMPAQKKLNAFIFWVGALSGRPGVAGSALLARSREREVVKWSDVHRVDLFPKQRIVCLRNTWRTDPPHLLHLRELRSSGCDGTGGRTGPCRAAAEECDRRQ